jgi:hypothetical protein
MLMRSTTRFMGLAFAATAAIALSAPTAGFADTATCTFDGIADLSPSMRRAPLLAGDSAYTFSASADCQYVDTTAPGAGTAYETSAQIAGTGLYRNDVCLTGWLLSNLDNPLRPGRTTISFANPNATGVTSMRYVARLTAGTGPLAIRDINGDPSHAGAGSLVSVPNRGSCVDPAGVSQLAIIGEFAATL